MISKRWCDELNKLSSWSIIRITNALVGSFTILDFETNESTVHHTYATLSDVNHRGVSCSASIPCQDPPI